MDDSSACGVFLGCVSEEMKTHWCLSLCFLTEHTHCSPAEMLVCISVDPLCVRLQGLPDFWDHMHSGRLKEVKGCHITPASVNWHGRTEKDENTHETGRD